jgi:hypothetical protein
MKTSLNEISEIEKYLLGKHDPAASLDFEGVLLTNESFRLKVHVQKKILMLVQLFYRRNLKADAENVCLRIFTDPAKKDFQQKVFEIFNKE